MCVCVLIKLVSKAQRNAHTDKILFLCLRSSRGPFLSETNRQLDKFQQPVEICSVASPQPPQLFPGSLLVINVADCDDLKATILASFPSEQ